MSSQGEAQDRGPMLGRRTVLQAAAAGAAAVGLAACSGGKSKSFSGSGNKKHQKQAVGNGQGVAPTPRHETVVVDQVEFTVFDSWNPYIPNGETYNSGLGQVGREYLWYLNMATGEIKPWLATKYEYANDNTRFTIHLNPRAKWSDGKAFTSADVKFTLDLLRRNPSLLGSGPATAVKKVTAPDPRTVAIDLKAADPRYHYNFICGIVGSFIVIPQHVWEKQDPTKFRNNPPVYTGPYVLDRVIQDHKMFVWKKNSKYWNTSELDPKPGYVVYRSSPPADAEFEQFKAAQVDVSAQGVIYQQLQSAVDGGYDSAVITPMLDPCPSSFWINCDPSRGALALPKVRLAISALVDRAKIGTKIWPLKVDPAVYPWPAYSYNDKWNRPTIAAKYPLTYDVDKAKRLLDEAGCTLVNGKRMYKGKALSWEVITPVAQSEPEYFIAQLMSQQLQAVGISSTAKALSSSIYSDRVNKGQFDIRSEWLCAEVYDPWQIYSAFTSDKYKPIGVSDNGANTPRLKDKSLDAVSAKLAKLSPDGASAKPLYDEGLEAWYAASPVVPEIQKKFAHMFNTAFWTGWPTPEHLYQVPNNWWGQFMFVIGSITPTGKK